MQNFGILISFEIGIKFWIGKKKKRKMQILNVDFEWYFVRKKNKLLCMKNLLKKIKIFIFNFFSLYHLKCSFHFLDITLRNRIKFQIRKYLELVLYHRTCKKNFQTKLNKMLKCCKLTFFLMKFFIYKYIYKYIYIHIDQNVLIK